MTGPVCAGSVQLGSMEGQWSDLRMGGWQATGEVPMGKVSDTWSLLSPPVEDFKTVRYDVDQAPELSEEEGHWLWHRGAHWKGH